MSRNPFLSLPLAFFLIGQILAADSTEVAQANATAPNLLVILVDDMGYGDPRCFNPDSRIPTPNIDRLARQGMKFTDAHAPGPLCHLSRYGLMTGRFPFRRAIRWQKAPAIAESRLTLPGFLRNRGYRTHMVGKWHLGFTSDDKFAGPLKGGPVDRGFDTFFGIRASTDIPPYFYMRDDRAVMPPSNRIEANQTEGWSPIQGAFWRAGGIAPDLKLQEVLPRFTREAISVIENHAARKEVQPMMLYLAYPAPHTPWLPSREFIGKSGAGLYGDFMHMVDSNIGQVLGALEKHSMSENTIVIFTSDNGPVWYDRDVERFQHDSSGGLRGMKADAWENGHRMPFIVRWPGKASANSVSSQLISFTDIFSTMAEILGTSIPEGQAPDSISFLATLKGQKDAAKTARKSLALAAGRGHMMVRLENWKLITGPGSGGFSGGPKKPGPGIPAGQLYDLADDPGETRNLFVQMPEKVNQLSQLLQKIRSAD